MYKWLFCFLKSVALVLTHLMQESSKKMSSQSQYPQNQLPQMPSKYKDDKNAYKSTNPIIMFNEKNFLRKIKINDKIINNNVNFL